MKNILSFLLFFAISRLFAQTELTRVEELVQEINAPGYRYITIPLPTWNVYKKAYVVQKYPMMVKRLFWNENVDLIVCYTRDVEHTVEKIACPLAKVEGVKSSVFINYARLLQANHQVNIILSALERDTLHIKDFLLAAIRQEIWHLNVGNPGYRADEWESEKVSLRVCPNYLLFRLPHIILDYYVQKRLHLLEGDSPAYAQMYRNYSNHFKNCYQNKKRFPHLSVHEFGSGDVLLSIIIEILKANPHLLDCMVSGILTE